MWLGQTAPLHNTLLLGLGNKETETNKYTVKFVLIAALSSFDPETWPVRRCLHQKVPEGGTPLYKPYSRDTQRQFSENICSEYDLKSRIFGTFVVKFLACLPLLGFLTDFYPKKVTYNFRKPFFG